LLALEDIRYFRAMDQWFIALDENNMRQRAQEAISQIRWIPDYGENRMRGSLSPTNMGCTFTGIF
jgi:isoleucyl-tRNA synthetase